MKIRLCHYGLSATVLLAALLQVPVARGEATVFITPDLPTVQVLNDGKPVTIERNPDTDNMVDPDFSLTSRPCPPYCIQPMNLPGGVETLGELELIAYLQRVGRDDSVLVIDSRDGDWPLRSGVIPGAVVIPWQQLHPAHTSASGIADLLMLRFDAVRQEGLWNFENARTLVFYCNGPWCGQSPTNIKQLMALGYPAQKLKWYRGGMQAWKVLGLATVPPASLSTSPTP
ncbi:MAG: rhodanese-like domain-containing protein [Pseudomonadota bacterium]